MPNRSDPHNLSCNAGIKDGGSGLSRPMEALLLTLTRLSAESVQLHLPAVTLGISPSDVARHAKVLCREGLLRFPKQGYLALTDRGRALGALLLQRKEAADRLLGLLFPTEIRADEAQRLAHALSLDTAQRLTQLLDPLSIIVAQNPRSVN